MDITVQDVQLSKGHNAMYEPDHEKMCIMSFANNNGADQPAHPRSLISAFGVHCLDSIISLDSIAEISSPPSFCGCAGRFVSGLVGNCRRHILSCRCSLSQVMRKCVLCHMRTTKAQISLRIRADRSAPLLLAAKTE